MSALRFKVGEIALLHSQEGDSACWPPQGTEVEILAVGPWPPGVELAVHGRLGTTQDGADYIVTDGRGALWQCADFELRKRRPPIPDDVLETFKTKDRAVPA